MSRELELYFHLLKKNPLAPALLGFRLNNGPAEGGFINKKVEMVGFEPTGRAITQFPLTFACPCDPCGPGFLVLVAILGNYRQARHLPFPGKLRLRSRCPRSRFLSYLEKIRLKEIVNIFCYLGGISTFFSKIQFLLGFLE
jgi:hypothetical protein